MLTRNMLNQFMQELLAVMNADYCSLTPCDPPPWEIRLVQAGFADEILATASYVLASLADECTGDSLQSWTGEVCKSWSVLLFRENSAGLHYYEKMDACERESELLPLWWLGLRAGFQGRFFGDANALSAWLTERGWHTAPVALSPLSFEIKASDSMRVGKPMPWWICGILWVVALVGYRVLTTLADRL